MHTHGPFSNITCICTCLTLTVVSSVLRSSKAGVAMAFECGRFGMLASGALPLGFTPADQSQSEKMKQRGKQTYIYIYI